VLGPHRGTIKGQEAPPLEDAINDRVREIVVVEDAAPGGQGLVGREDHRAPVTMAITDDMKEHVGRVGPVGEVADLVDDEYRRMRVGGQRVGESPCAEGRREIVDQFGSRHKQRIETVLDSAIGNGDREMRFASARFADQNQRPSFRDEIRGEVSLRLLDVGRLSINWIVRMSTPSASSRRSG
jgi:hypothetical protein